MTAGGRSSLLSTISDTIRNSALASGPSGLRGTARVHVLFSTPSSAKEVYPFAHVDPQSSRPPPKPVDAFVEHVFCTVSWAEEQVGQADLDGDQGQQHHASDNQQHATDRARLIYAMECYLYTIPSQRAAVLYVSKVDSTGWAPRAVDANLVDFVAPSLTGRASVITEREQANPSSLIRLTTTAFLSHFASLRHWSKDETSMQTINHCSIHVLARSQGAYLFPSSPDNPLKRVLPDGKLIAWWRNVLSDVNASTGYKGRNFYVVPGYDSSTARELLPAAPKGENTALSKAGWVYGHPYTRGQPNSAPLPLHRRAGVHVSRDDRIHFGPRPDGSPATLMPHFPDDPKSRFISELARDAHELASAPLDLARNSTEADASTGANKRPRLDIDDTSVHDEATLPNTSRTTEDIAAHVPKPSTEPLTAAFKALFKERSALDAISPDEFWERMGFRQECCAGNAVGVFVCIFDEDDVHEKQEHSGSRADGQQAYNSAMSAQPMALPSKVLSDVIFRHLLRDVCDWSSWEKARELTQAWHNAVLRALMRKGGVSQVKEQEQAVQAQEAKAEGALTASPLAQDVIWSDIYCNGPTHVQLARAREEWEKAGRPLPRALREEQAKKEKVVVNTLSVKRKKKSS